MQVETTGEIILTDSEAKSLTETEAGKHLVEELKLMLNKSRLEVDYVEQARLTGLQGRISALKDILNLLGT